MDAINRFIQTHHPRMIALAVAHGLTLADAEDCAQRAWLYLHQSGRLTAELPVSYLVTTMRGRMLDHWRSQRLHAKRGTHVAIDDAHGLASERPSPADEHDLKLLRRALHRMGAYQPERGEIKRGAARVRLHRQRKQWAQRLAPLQHLTAA